MRARFLGYGAVAALALVTAAAASSPSPWRPDMRDAIRYASHRHGAIAIAVRTRTRFWGWHYAETFPSASVVKAMLLVAYLDMPSVRNRPLRASDRGLLTPMIRQSDNDAASEVLQIVGSDRMYALARRAHMRRFTLVTGTWGFTRIDAADQTRYSLHINALMARGTARTEWGSSTRSRRFSAGVSRGFAHRAGGCTSREAGATAGAGSTTRSPS